MKLIIIINNNNNLLQKIESVPSLIGSWLMASTKIDYGVSKTNKNRTKNEE